MEWKNRLTKTPYLVLFILLGAIGVGTASALITITLSGDVIITGGLGMTGDKITDVGSPTVNTDAATKGYVDQASSTDTLALLGCTTDEIAKFDGNNWGCVPDEVIDADSDPTNEIQTLVDLGIKKVELPDSACVEDRGWCPDGAKTLFNIIEPDINHDSFIGIMVKDSFTNFDCAVTTTTLTVFIGFNFHIKCNTPPENGDRLFYFVIN